MTPERRAEFDKWCSMSEDMRIPVWCLRECLAEIDRLNADRDQLSNALDIAAAELESQTKEIYRLNKVVDQACEIIGELLGDEDRPLKTRPDLAAELERRSKS